MGGCFTPERKGEDVRERRVREGGRGREGEEGREAEGEREYASYMYMYSIAFLGVCGCKEGVLREYTQWTCTCTV